MDLRSRFTERARNVMRLAAEEAARVKSAAVEPEHILLALLGDGGGVAASVLRNLGLTPGTIVMDLEKHMHRRASSPPVFPLFQCAGGERIVEYAIEAARDLNHDYVGTEHVLLGLLRDGTGIASRVLADLGLSLAAAREETLRLLGRSAETSSAGEDPAPPGAPVLDPEREFFMRLYRLAVDFYKPKIEKRTGVVIGNILVWDFSRFHLHVLRELKRRQSPRCAEGDLERMAAKWADHARRCAASYFNSAIYLSFASNTSHENAVAGTVVHELSHGALGENRRGAARRKVVGGPPFRIRAREVHGSNGGLCDLRREALVRRLLSDCRERRDPRFLSGA